jgi:hypothetical protein
MARSARSSLRLNEALIEQISTVLRAGNYVDTAAKMVGVPRSAIYRWLNEGDKASQKADSGEELNRSERLYLDFMNAVDQARATATVRNVALVQQAAQAGSWQAAAWWLERTNPQQWGRRMQTEIVGANEGPVQVNISVDDLESLIQQIANDA